MDGQKLTRCPGKIFLEVAYTIYYVCKVKLDQHMHSYSRQERTLKNVYCSRSYKYVSIIGIFEPMRFPTDLFTIKAPHIPSIDISEVLKNLSRLQKKCVRIGRVSRHFYIWRSK